MFDGLGGTLHQIPLTLYTDAFVIRGTCQTRQRRITDILNQADERFLVLTEATFDEFGTAGRVVRAEFAQVNLRSVIFAVADTPVEPAPELRTPKQAEQALISVPPFTVTGQIHLMPERSLRESLSELIGHFLPVTDATYWSDSLGEARTTAILVAVNHERAQILAPHREVDPWAGLDPGAGSAVPPPTPPASADDWPSQDALPPRDEPTGW
jgi:hypothetical protein